MQPHKDFKQMILFEIFLFICLQIYLQSIFLYFVNLFHMYKVINPKLQYCFYFFKNIDIMSNDKKNIFIKHIS